MNSLNRHEEALLCLDRAIELDPNYENAWFNKISAFIGLRRYADALLCCESVLEINPHDVQVYMAKGAVLLVLKRFAEALECYDQVMRSGIQVEEAVRMRLPDLVKACRQMLGKN